METLIKEAKPMGNSASVYVPKEWEGKKVVVRLLSPRELILDELKNHLPAIKGIYLYGSTIRGEEEKDSDIDVLVITDREIEIKSDELDITCITEEKAKEILRTDPIQLYPMLAEAIAVMNEQLLHELKKIKPAKQSFGGLVSSTEEKLKELEKLIEGEKKLDAVVYSMVMRSRALYIADQILRGRKYYRVRYENYMIKHGLSPGELGRLMGVYKLVRDEKPLPGGVIYLEDIILMHSVLRNQVNDLKRLVYG